MTLKFKGEEKTLSLSEILRVKIFDGTGVEVLSPSELKNLRLKTGADYVFELPDKNFATNADSLAQLVVT